MYWFCDFLTLIPSEPQPHKGLLALIEFPAERDLAVAAALAGTESEPPDQVATQAYSSTRPWRGCPGQGLGPLQATWEGEDRTVQRPSSLSCCI